MDLLQPLTPSNFQPFIDNPEQLVTQPVEFQITVASYLETPRCLLEVLVNSPDTSSSRSGSIARKLDRRDNRMAARD